MTNSPRTLTYDTKGNMTTDDRGCGMTWDFDNMLQSFAANGVTDLKNATYEYDAIGRRVAKNVAETGGTQTTVFVQAGQALAATYDSETLNPNMRIYATYLDDAICVISSQTSQYYCTDTQYSVVAITTQVGEVAVRYSYSKHGVQRRHANDGTALEPFDGDSTAFTGRYIDGESGNAHFRTRIYSASNGLFFTRDAIGYLSGNSLYCSYFAVKGVDPYGLDPDIVIDIPNDHHIFPQGNGLRTLIESHCSGFSIDTFTIPVDSIRRGNLHHYLQYACPKELYGKNWNQLVLEKLRDGDCCNFLTDVSSLINNVWNCAWKHLLGPGGVVPPLTTHPHGSGGPDNWGDFDDFLKKKCKQRDEECMRKPIANPYVNTMPGWVPEDPGNDGLQDICVVGAIAVTVVGGYAIIVYASGAGAAGGGAAGGGAQILRMPIQEAIKHPCFGNAVREVVRKAG